MLPQRNRTRVLVQRAPRTRSARALWASAELTVTFGVVVLLLVVHQVWWTNQQARAGARQQVQVLEEEFSRGVESSDVVPGSEAGAESGAESESEEVGGSSSSSSSSSSPPRRSSFAVLRIPALSLSVPVASGVGRRAVLDKGFVGQYPRTAAPGAAGNFALAGHRNTHGEPFRYINRLRKGDEIRVRTKQREYVYVVDRILARTSPRDTGVIAPVPRSLVHPSSGYDEPGSYLTLTTCTPEFSSAYRLVIWAKLRL
ncbi:MULTISPECIES: class E sortase [Streptomyces]|uniref:Class E sortase n=1 Tax=Streptomyces solicathayae TaxID=3081768 RepID=A0ABZ0LXJ3_9ACTN|nr:class E sortase [Streptomyces sp. HUAS YS2]WOX24154.1 class E sortase [Streptomyces sp. HUAS YS2]